MVVYYVEESSRHADCKASVETHLHRASAPYSLFGFVEIITELGEEGVGSGLRLGEAVGVRRPLFATSAS